MRPKVYDPDQAVRSGSNTFRMTREEELRKELGLDEGDGNRSSGDSDDENTNHNTPAPDVASWRQKIQEQISIKENAQKETERLRKEMESMHIRQKEELASIRQMSRSQLQILKTTIQKRDARIVELKRDLGDTQPEEDAAQSLITPRVFQTPRIPDTARSFAGTEVMGGGGGSDVAQVRPISPRTLSATKTLPTFPLHSPCGHATCRMPRNHRCGN